jgi:hypothetical protein
LYYRKTKTFEFILDETQIKVGSELINLALGCHRAWKRGSKIEYIKREKYVYCRVISIEHCKRIWRTSSFHRCFNSKLFIFAIVIIRCSHYMLHYLLLIPLCYILQSIFLGILCKVLRWVQLYVFRIRLKIHCGIGGIGDRIDPILQPILRDQCIIL